MKRPDSSHASEQHWELAISLLVVGGFVLLLVAGGWHMVHRLSESPLQLSTESPLLLPQPDQQEAQDDSLTRKRNRAAWQTPYEIGSESVQLCQALGPAAPNDPGGIDCTDGSCEAYRAARNGPLHNSVLPYQGWKGIGPVDFQQYAQGEYVGHSRLPHVPEYRLRVDDELEFMYRVTRDETAEPYQINIGDELRIESFTDKDLDRTLVVQPDGTITLRLLGQVKVTRHTIESLREDLEERYKKFYKLPSITVTPITVNAKLEDLRYTVGGRSGFGGQRSPGKVNPDGTVTLPGIDPVMAQGLTVAELKQELGARYAQTIEGIEVTPILIRRAARYVFVVGEVRQPGRYTLEGPTTVMQSIALAGSWNVGAAVSEVVIFRRADDWRLIATKIDIRAALLGRQPCPAGELWVNDSDLIIVPKSGLLLADNFIEMFFTRGVYGIIPFSTAYQFNALTAIK